jgi:hypothetical protein
VAGEGLRICLVSVAAYQHQDTLIKEAEPQNSEAASPFRTRGSDACVTSVSPPTDGYGVADAYCSRESKCRRASWQRGKTAVCRLPKLDMWPPNTESCGTMVNWG